MKLGYASNGVVTGVLADDATGPRVAEFADSDLVAGGIAARHYNITGRAPTRRLRYGTTTIAYELADSAIVTSGETVDAVSASSTGAIAGARFVGGTTSGPPVTGSFEVGDYVVDQTGHMWICSGAGSPGTWVDTSSGRMLDRGESGDQFATNPATERDIPACSVDFSVVSRPVLVHGYAPLCGNTTGTTASVTMKITDEDNVQPDGAVQNALGNNQVGIDVYELIPASAPGDYTRKLRGLGSTTSGYLNLIGLGIIFITATEV